MNSTDGRPDAVADDDFEARFRRTVAANQKVVDAMVAEAREQRQEAASHDPRVFEPLGPAEIEYRRRVIRDMRDAGETWANIGKRLGLIDKGVILFTKRYPLEEDGDA